MIKLGLDVSPLRTAHKHRGVGYYVKNLLDELQKNPELEITEFADREKLKQSVDLIHYTFFYLFRKSLPIKPQFPFVVTVHDLTPILYSNHYPPGIRGRLIYNLQRLTLKNAKAIITLSENAKKDIVKILQFDPERVNVIYLGINDSYKKINNKDLLKNVKNKYKLPEKFALFVGSVNWNKNLVNMAQACIHANMELILVGGDFLKRDNLKHAELKSFAEFLKKFKDNPLVHMIGYVELTDLVTIYNLADISLLVSFAEGFGFPILEGQSVGTPVITSNISSMPEIAGEGAVLVDPSNIEQITKAIVAVRDNYKLRNSLIEKGFKNIKRFTWKKTAEETFRVYEQALQ